MATHDVNAVDLHLEDVEDYAADYPKTDAGYPNAENNMAPAGGSDVAGRPTSPSYRRAAFIALVRNNKWAFGAFGVVLIVLISVIASSSKGSNTDGQSPSYSKDYEDYDQYDVGVLPIKMHHSDVDFDVYSEFKDTILSVYERHGLDDNLLEEVTPQRQAVLWMASNPKVNELEHTDKLQRYVLAAFFYSTNMIPSVHVEDPKAWKVATNWMSDATSCDWMGIECNSQGVITGIFLEGNRLSGGLPPDLAIIASKIETLDFADNIMHMRDDDFDVFKSLTNLKTLLMDDNFLYHDKGLPPQFAEMKNLEKLRLSYNVFEGELDSEAPVLASMTKMTHLEMESNYFSGTMPAAIGAMDQLTYLYMRRNDMNFNLDFFKEAQFTENIFAMWLDDNYIDGSIPSEIGKFTNLASFSCSKGNLEGPIPTEFGKLQQLRRLWLFDNKLTGTIPQELNELGLLEVVELHKNELTGAMPEGVCSSVKNADYDFSSLTSDCNSGVACSKACCTECY